MSDTTEEFPAVAAVKAKLYADVATVPDFAQAAERTERTIFSWIAEGLPTVYVGNTPFVKIEDGVEWVRTRRQRALNPRKPGRPKGWKPPSST